MYTDNGSYEVRNASQLTLLGSPVVPFSLHSIIIESGDWKSLEEVVDPYLQQLAVALPEAVSKDHPASTGKKYANAFVQWCAWASEHGEPRFPAKGSHIAPPTSSQEVQ